MILTTETLNNFEQSLVNNSNNLVKFVITVAQTQVDETTIHISYSSTATINQLNTLIASGKTPVFIINSVPGARIEYYYLMLFINFIDSETFRVELMSADLDYLSAVDANSPLTASFDKSIGGGGGMVI